MHKRVLIAEQADTVRAVAEAVLRQNGYDVIAVTAAEKAREVLELSKPDLLIIGADLAAPDGTPYYERLRQESRTANTPTLLIEAPDKTPISLSDLTVIPRPFDPQDFLQKVAVALMGGTPSGAKAGPLSGAEVDDDFLDAALGLGNIDVTSSEVLDKTSHGTRLSGAAPGEKHIGMESHSDSKSSDTGQTKIDSVVLDMNSSRVRHQVPGRQVPVEGTGKLEILSDQYGLEKPLLPLQNENADHDYDWFIDAIKKDNDPKAAKAAPHETGSLVISESSAAVDPRTPGPAAKSHGVDQPAAVEKFIDEFKKEMQQLREVEPDTAANIPEIKTIKAASASEKLDWEEKLEQIGPTEVDTFTREFARELGRRVAEIIAAKIDPEKLMRLIRAEVAERYKKK
jgi:DNA-binding response OmpR family regulator